MNVLFGLLAVLIACHLAGIVLPIGLHGRPGRPHVLAYGAAAAGGACAVALGLGGLLAAGPLTAALPSTIPLLTFGIRLDPLAAFFVLTVGFAALAVSIYALAYAPHAPGRSTLWLGAGYNGFLLSMVLVVLADNALFFLICWEAMAVLSYLLVVSDHEQPEVRRAGLFYLVMAQVATAFVVLAFVLLFQSAGSFAFEAFRRPDEAPPAVLRTAAFLAALIGFGAKAGIVPLHVWLPYAHPAAPSHVSALMSGVMIKTAIYGMLRVWFDFLGGPFPAWWGALVLALGAISALLGVMYALMEHDLKRLLAFHSVENIGIILLGIGAGMIFHGRGLQEFAALGVVAGLYHTLNHAVFKALLFLGAGSLLYATRTRNMEEYGGLLRRMPWTGALFLVGAVSIAALPPTNGFMSEWLVFQSLFLSVHLPDLFLKLLLPVAAAVLALTSVLALACFVKAFGIPFLGRARSTHARRAGEVPVPMRVGMGILAAGCVGLGLAPMLVVPVLDRVSAPLTGVSIAQKTLALDGWAVAPVRVEFSSVSPPVLALLLVALAGVALVLPRLFARPARPRRVRTWGCGIRVSPRMQYTATGFAQPIRQVFSTIVRPSVKLETELLEESRYFAKRRRFEFSIEPVFERYLYDPVARCIAGAADRFRVIQAGSLHVYLAYIFVTLVTLLLLAR